MNCKLFQEVQYFLLISAFSADFHNIMILKYWIFQGDSFNSNVMQQDELLRVTLRRGTGGIGLSIVAAQVCIIWFFFRYMKSA